MKINKMFKKSLIIALLFNNMHLNSFASTYNIENSVVKNGIEEKWETGLAEIPEARSMYSSGVVDGKIYIIGGGSSTSMGTYTKTVYVYDIENDSWEKRSDISEYINMASSVTINKDIYLIGGNITGNHSTPSNKVYKYNTVTGTLTECADMPTARSGSRAVLLNGKIYVVGGRETDSVYSNVVEIYDPKTDTWDTNVANLNLGRTGLGVEVVNGKIYAFGGKNSNSDYTNKIEVYNPQTNEWTYLSNMNNSTGYLASAVILDKIYVFGGYNGSLDLNSVQEYDIAQDIWTDKPAMPQAKSSLNANYYNGKFYLIGGDSGDTVTKTSLAYYAKELTLEDYALEAVEKASSTKELVDIETARKLVNQLPDGEIKTQLQDRLDAIVPNISLELKNSTSILDIYIKSENMLSMTLDTNSVSFENFSGVDEIEKQGAINITINSSLPYELNAYMMDEMYNNDKSQKIDMNRLNIKDNLNDTDTNYKEFTAINTKLILNDSCDAGNDIEHIIDLKLKGGEAYPADIYKTTIKFEAEQK